MVERWLRPIMKKMFGFKKELTIRLGEAYTGGIKSFGHSKTQAIAHYIPRNVAKPPKPSVYVIDPTKDYGPTSFTTTTRTETEASRPSGKHYAPTYIGAYHKLADKNQLDYIARQNAMTSLLQLDSSLGEQAPTEYKEEDIQRYEIDIDIQLQNLCWTYANTGYSTSVSSNDNYPYKAGNVMIIVGKPKTLRVFFLDNRTPKSLFFEKPEQKDVIEAEYISSINGEGFKLITKGSSAYVDNIREYLSDTYYTVITVLKEYFSLHKTEDNDLFYRNTCPMTDQFRYINQHLTQELDLYDFNPHEGYFTQHRQINSEQYAVDVNNVLLRCFGRVGPNTEIDSTRDKSKYWTCSNDVANNRYSWTENDKNTEQDNLYGPVSSTIKGAEIKVQSAAEVTPAENTANEKPYQVPQPYEPAPVIQQGPAPGMQQVPGQVMQQVPGQVMQQVPGQVMQQGLAHVNPNWPFISPVPPSDQQGTLREFSNPFPQYFPVVYPQGPPGPLQGYDQHGYPKTYPPVIYNNYPQPWLPPQHFSFQHDAATPIGYPDQVAQDQGEAVMSSVLSPIR